MRFDDPFYCLPSSQIGASTPVPSASQTRIDQAFLKPTRNPVEAATVVPRELPVTITVPYEVAQTLLTLYWHVGGNSRYSRRAHMFYVSDALRSAGVRDLDPTTRKRVLSGTSIHFADEKGLQFTTGIAV